MLQGCVKNNKLPQRPKIRAVGICQRERPEPLWEHRAGGQRGGGRRGMGLCVGVSPRGALRWPWGVGMGLWRSAGLSPSVSPHGVVFGVGGDGTR